MSYPFMFLPTIWEMEQFIGTNFQNICSAISVYAVQSAFKAQETKHNKGKLVYEKGDSFLSISTIAFYAQMREENVRSTLKSLESAKIGEKISLYNSVKPKGRGKAYNLYDWGQSEQARELSYHDTKTGENLTTCKHPTIGIDVVQKGIWRLLTPSERYLYYLIREQAQSIAYALESASPGECIACGILPHYISCDWISSDKLEAIKQHVTFNPENRISEKTIQRAISRFSFLHLIEYVEEGDSFRLKEYGIEPPEEFDKGEEDSIIDNGYILRRGFPMFESLTPPSTQEKSAPNSAAKKRQEKINSMTYEERKKQAEELGLRLKEDKKTEAESKLSEGGAKEPTEESKTKTEEEAPKAKAQGMDLLKLLEEGTK